jgi:NLI interacting factor-like phosphatase
MDLETPVRKSTRLSMAQQETRHRMLHYLTASVHPLLEEDDEVQQGLTSDAFPAVEPSMMDPKEPLAESLPLNYSKMIHTSPKDPSLTSSGTSSTTLLGKGYSATALLRSGQVPIEAPSLSTPSATHLTSPTSTVSSTPNASLTPSMASPSVARYAFDLFSLSLNDIKSLFNSLPDTFFPRRRLHLPKKPKTLVLDLDETLIHSTCKSTKSYDMMIEVLMNKNSCLYYVSKRPFCDYFLKKVSQWYNLVIFTASLPEYAEPVIDWLDNGARVLQQRLFRSVSKPDALFS